jgi:transmembrane sensor
MKLDDTTREEAAAWFAALRRGPMSLEERAAFDAWRADPRNQAALHGMHELWGEVSAIKELGVGVPSPAAARWRRLAAGLAVAVALGGASLLVLQPFGQQVRTGVGEQRVANLDDGSVVGLNVVTRVSYDMNKPERRLVRLEDGEAVFYVRKNAQRPFVVRAGDYEIRALGTAFNVRCRDDLVDVAVIQGWVSVRAVSGPRAGEEIARLKAGEKLKLDPAQAPTPEPVAVDSVAEWRLRIVGYEDASVGTVVEDLNRFFDRPIVVRDDGLANRRVTIRLQVEDRERTLRTLGALLDAQVTPQTRADLLVPAATS